MSVVDFSNSFAEASFEDNNLSETHEKTGSINGSSDSSDESNCEETDQISKDTNRQRRLRRLGQKFQCKHEQCRKKFKSELTLGNHSRSFHGTSFSSVYGQIHSLSISI